MVDITLKVRVSNIAEPNNILMVHRDSIVPVVYCKRSDPKLFPIFLVKLYSPDAPANSSGGISERVIVFRGMKKIPNPIPVKKRDPAM